MPLNPSNNFKFNGFEELLKTAIKPWRIAEYFHSQVGHQTEVLPTAGTEV